MNILNKKMMLSLGLVVVTAISGCANNGQTQASVETRYCSMPQSKQLNVAIEESRSILSNRNCQSDYADQFSTLVTIAAGEPSEKNLETLGIQSQWMVKKGIISKKESEAMLRRYFSPQLVSLDYESDFNTYSHCSMNSKQGEITRLLDQELEQKRQGLAMALGDNKAYKMALKEHQSVKLLLESTRKACRGEG